MGSKMWDVETDKEQISGKTKYRDKKSDSWRVKVLRNWGKTLNIWGKNPRSSGEKVDVSGKILKYRGKTSTYWGENVEISGKRLRF